MMAKPIKLKEARCMLRDANCILIRTGNHEVWKRSDGKVFSLPAAKRNLSMGVVRMLTYFIDGHENYSKR